MDIFAKISTNPVKSAIPNAFTIINLLLGCVGIALAFNDNLAWAGAMILIAAAADFLDGFFARLLNAQSAIGAQLDSLADLVTFGVLPGSILFQLLSIAQGDYFTPIAERPITSIVISGLGFLFSAFAAYRLARFNVDTSQKTSFSGLPSPAAAIGVAMLPMVLGFQYSFNYFIVIDELMWTNLMRLYPGLDGLDSWSITTFQNTIFLLGYSLALGLWMVLPIRMFSLKIKSLKWSESKWQYMLIIASVLTVAYSWSAVFFLVPWSNAPQFLAIGIILVLYLLLSILKSILNR